VLTAQVPTSFCICSERRARYRARVLHDRSARLRLRLWVNTVDYRIFGDEVTLLVGLSSDEDRVVSVKGISGYENRSDSLIYILLRLVIMSLVHPVKIQFF